MNEEPLQPIVIDYLNALKSHISEKSSEHIPDALQSILHHEIMQQFSFAIILTLTAFLCFKFKDKIAEGAFASFYFGVGVCCAPIALYKAIYIFSLAVSPDAFLLEYVTTLAHTFDPKLYLLENGASCTVVSR